MSNRKTHSLSAMAAGKVLAVLLFVCLAIGAASIVDSPFGRAGHLAYADPISETDGDEFFDISNAIIYCDDAYYTGYSVTPTVNVYYDGTKLVEGIDYKLSFANNISIGKNAAVTITGIGRFTGSKTQTFAILHAPGWAYEQDGWYHYNAYGELSKSTWVQKDGSWCYVGSNGKRVENDWAIYNGKYYYMNSNGVAVVNDWVVYNGNYYYMNKNGNPVVNGWVYSGGKYFYMNKNGNPVVNGWVSYGGKYYYMNDSGNPVVNGWVSYGGKWYYMNGNGNPVVNGWVQSGGKYYYLGSSGAMATSQWIGGKYYVGADGAYVATSGGGSSSGGGTQTYVLNTNSYKFHYPNCSSVSKMSNSNKKYYTGTRAQVIAMGYEPCKNCNP